MCAKNHAKNRFVCLPKTRRVSLQFAISRIGECATSLAFCFCRFSAKRFALQGNYVYFLSFFFAEMCPGVPPSRGRFSGQRSNSLTESTASSRLSPESSAATASRFRSRPSAFRRHSDSETQFCRFNSGFPPDSAGPGYHSSTSHAVVSASVSAPPASSSPASNPNPAGSAVCHSGPGTSPSASRLKVSSESSTRF